MFEKSHWISYWDGYNFLLISATEPIILVCVHPLSLQLQVPGDGSESHVSTGSTVKTFLTQDDLAPPYSPYEPSMADIDEVRSENSDGGDNNGGGDNIWSRICF